ncbi:hypothetical protein PQX77_005553, partial [Marasmius sp. AFHP31]
FISLVTGSVLSRAGDPAISIDIIYNRTRLILFFEHNENLTFQEFSDYLRGPHAKLFLGTKAVRQNLLRYEQLHVNQTWKQELKNQGYRVPVFDGVMIAEAENIDKINEAFNNKEYNDTVIPDTHKFAIPASGHAAAVKITSVVNKLPDETTMPDSEMGVIRKDVQRLVGYFSHKSGMDYQPDFVRYWAKVDTPGLMNVVKSIREDKEVLQYELNTLDPVTPTINNRFGPFKDWDAVGVLSGQNIKELMDVLKNPQIESFMRQDAPNFVDLNKEIDIIPCDVVSYKIPPP